MTKREEGLLRTITYNFKFDDGREKEFVLNLDSETLDMAAPAVNTPKDWTVLDFKKCPNCNLDASQHNHCPVAVNMSELINFIDDIVSYEKLDVVVEVPERKYMARVPIQVAASSMMGIIMVTSGCPVLDKLRALVDTHLPFASLEETSYRVVSMYLFGQYFKHKNGGEPDWDMKGLVDFFDEVEKVNIAFCQRLDEVRLKDAGVNAVAILNCFGSMTKMSVTSNMFDHWERLISI